MMTWVYLVIQVYMADRCRKGTSRGIPGNTTPSQKIQIHPKRIEKSTTPKKINRVESRKIFKKYSIFPLTTPETFIPIVIGANMNTHIVSTFMLHKSLSRFSTSHVPIKRVFVISGKTYVISRINRYAPRPKSAPNIAS